MVTDATRQELLAALNLVNGDYNENIEFRRLDKISKNRQAFTLTVRDSKGPGAKISRTIWGTRRVKAACWHVHGDFFDALFTINPKAFVRSRGRYITLEAGNWQDFNVGSEFYPVYASESCEC